MSVATINRGATRAAIMNWRDAATLAALALAHETAAGAMRALEARLGTVALGAAMIDPEEAARAIVRPTLRDLGGAAADRWFTDQARSLRQVDPLLEPLALRFAAMASRPLLPAPLAESEDRRLPAWIRAPFDALSDALDRAAGDRMRAGIEQASARVGHEFGERSGARERLRAAARRDLAQVWLGPDLDPDEAEPRPYLTQLFALVDRTADEAREMVA